MYNQYTQFHQTIITTKKIEQPLLNLGDVGTPLANDLGAVLRVNFQYQREALQFLKQ